MADLATEQKLAKAVRHILFRIREHPEVGYYLGLGTEGFALLTEAYAASSNKPVEEIRNYFLPTNPRNPRDDNDASDETIMGAMGPLQLELVDESFVRAMEKELQANQNKGDWKAWQPDRLACLDELFHHFHKLRRSIQQNDTERVAEHSADLANIAMKTHERHGRA